MTPNLGIDAIQIGSNIISQLYTILNSKIPPIESGTLSIYKAEGGSNAVTISDNFLIHGSLRVFTIKSFEVMKDQI
jgi:metal-dependent amidase/aminoacylase/carboxypeptidase family protein